MADIANSHLTSRLDRGGLILTLTEPELHGDELVGAISQEMKTAVTSANAKKVVVDFQQVRFISAAGLRAMLDFRRFLRERSATLLLCSLTTDVADVFVSTKLATTTPSSVIPFAMAPDLPAALAHFTQSR